MLFEICDVAFRDERDLAGHLVESEVRHPKCLLCRLVFPSKEDFKAHNERLRVCEGVLDGAHTCCRRHEGFGRE